MQVTPRQFIEAWQGSSSVAEVARKVRAKKNAVRVRGFRYRKMGIPLKEFPVVEIEPTDWDELARYAEELAAGQADGAQPSSQGEEHGD
jgi:hypothetical protein